MKISNSLKNKLRICSKQNFTINSVKLILFLNFYFIYLLKHQIKFTKQQKN